MPGRQEEDFELVLGNKQLLSLFFIIVVFFAGFFAIGYAVGYGHGEAAGPQPTLARADPPKEQTDDVTLPRALLKDAPEPPSPTAVEQASAAAKQPPKPEKPKPEPRQAARTDAAPKPSPTRPAAPRAPSVRSAVTANGSHHIQVASVTVRKDADLLAGKLEKLGYPAQVRSWDKWNRVVVGPFMSYEAAKVYAARLKKDGFGDTLIRRF